MAAPADALDGTELWVADVTDEGRLGRSRRIAGGETESIVQPGWSPDGSLYFVSDRTGWWNLYRTEVGLPGLPTPVYPIDADCGRPQWILGTSTWTCAGPSTLVIACAEHGTWRLFGFTPRERSAPLTDADRRPVTDLEPGGCCVRGARCSRLTADLRLRRAWQPGMTETIDPLQQTQ